MKLDRLSVLYEGEPKAGPPKAAYGPVSQLTVERSSKGTRASVKEQDYMCHVHIRNDGLAGVAIADSERPSQVACTLLEYLLDEFSKQVNRIGWPGGSPATIHSAALDGHLSRYQNPREADPMTNVQAKPDETQIILHNTSKSLFEQGEKPGGLMSKFQVLGMQSTAFPKTAQKHNSCCAIT
ncbi:palmitoyltransferase [Saguinus oedipus]|uniref:Palmitoyltransferase n=1 Tax=Saguinus oedipus TaxID=9490 RepID=A0ABQ9VZJ9_SAGOE|nr:palmitoyltransferase [Saguinus oedipus]